MPEPIGPTGEFERGKIRKDDRGGLNVAITHGDDYVFIDFGTSITWLALTKAEALQFASMLTKNAEYL